MKRLIVVDDPTRWSFNAPNAELVSVSEYLSSNHTGRGWRVFNLSASYRYQSRGYYVSLLAEAREQKVIPTVRTIQELNATEVIRFLPNDINQLVQKSLKNHTSDSFTLSVYFGENISPKYQALAAGLYQILQAPLISFRFRRGKSNWSIRGIRALAVDDVPVQHLDFLKQAAERYFSRKRYASDEKDSNDYDLAILTNPEEKSPPSDKKALDKFVKAARKANFSVEFITRADYNRIDEFDALFIRETTSVDHYTWRMARRAAADGLVVIDDPESILKCANKVYLAEALKIANVPTPKTMVVQKTNADQVIGTLGLPCVLKLPDSCFSVGVEKVSTAKEYEEKIAAMLKESELIIAQEYLPTDYDWRVGVLDGKAIFACQYFMARGHWQIYNWKSSDADDSTGDFKTLAIKDTPPAIVSAAVKAAKLIGDGLYGVDLKEVNGKPVVIEINDNPSIDSGVEDQVLGDELYHLIARSLRRRIEEKAARATGATA